jgi:hypothetical protein
MNNTRDCLSCQKARLGVSGGYHCGGSCGCACNPKR